MKDKILISGLGNPEKKYQNTRHNVGFIVLDSISSNYEESFRYDKKLESEIFKTKNTFFIKPQTYMNNSGRAVAKSASFYKIKPENIIIVSDDADLRLGEIRIREKGSSAGHKGVESVITHLGTSDFPRIRIGISSIDQKEKSEHFVLKPFYKNETKIIKEVISKTTQEIENILKTKEIVPKTIKIKE